MSFDKFYAAYPNKQGKAKAKEKWDRMKYGDRIEDILAKLDVEKKWRKEKLEAGHFVAEWPMCSTYINQARWDDELDWGWKDTQPQTVQSPTTCPLSLMALAVS